MKDYKIEIVGYKYILLIQKETGRRGIYSISENFIIPVETNMGAIIDPMDNDGEIIYVNYDEILTKSIKSPKINQEMYGIFLDVRKKSRDYYLYNKIGLEHILQKHKYHISYSSPTSASPVYLSNTAYMELNP